MLLDECHRKVLSKISAISEKVEKCKKSEAVEEMEYLKAYFLYEKGHYSESAVSFTKLLLVNGMKKNYWFGLAAAEQLAKNYQASLSAWSMAALLDPFDAYPHFHAAECLLSQGEVKEALLALIEAKNRSTENELLSKIAALQEIWQE